MKKVLITGANGQLGSCLNIVMSHEIKNFEILNTDHKDLDITDFASVEKILKEAKPDIVINCAAYTAVDKAESDEDKAYQVNAIGPENLAKVCATLDIILFHISTDFVFDGQHASPINETKECKPLSVYGKSKSEGEKAIIEQHAKHFIIRTSWLYSSFGNNFFNTITKYSKERESLNVVYDQIGTPTYAMDLARVILKMLYANSNAFGIYHYSNEGVASWYDFAKELVAFQGINCRILPILTEAYPTPAKRPSYSVLDKAKIKNLLAEEIPYWKDSLKDCILMMESAEGLNL